MMDRVSRQVTEVLQKLKPRHCLASPVLLAGHGELVSAGGLLGGGGWMSFSCFTW